MGGSCEVGTCDICEVSGVMLSRQYYNYDIKCDCCSPNHFEIVHYCNTCTPKAPENTIVWIKPKEK